MGTTLTYNGISLVNCLTLDFQEEAIYDESNTDLMYHKFTISVEATVHGSSATLLHGVSDGSSGAATHQNLQTRLQHPRRPLSYVVGGVTLVQSDETVDVDSGPKPLHFAVKHISNSIFTVEFKVECAILRCDGYQPADPPTFTSPVLLSNRWAMTESIQDVQTWSRTIEGTFRTRHHSIAPHAVRALAIPPLTRGWRRKSMEFVGDKNSKSLKYRIVDITQHAAPVPPAVKWNGSHTQRLSNNGAQVYNDVDVTLIGHDQLTDRTALIAAAVQIVHATIGDLRKKSAAPADDPHTFTVPEFSITDYLHEARVNVRVTVLRGNVIGFLGLGLGRLGKQLDDGPLEPIGIAGLAYDHLVNPIPYTYPAGSAAALFVNKMNEPCKGAQVLGEQLAPDVIRNADRDNQQQPEDAPDTVTLRVEAELPEEQETKFSEEHLSSVYQHYEIDSRYIFHSGKYAAPLATEEEGADTLAVVSLHGATCRRVMKVVASRVGKAPELPVLEETSTDPNGITETLLSHEVLPVSPILLPDGRYERKVELVARYALSRAPTVAEVLRVGSTPIDDEAAATWRFSLDGVGKQGLI